MELLNAGRDIGLGKVFARDINQMVVFLEHVRVDHDDLRRAVLEREHQFPVGLRQNAAVAAHVVLRDPVILVKLHRINGVDDVRRAEKQHIELIGYFAEICVFLVAVLALYRLPQAKHDHPEYA